MAYAIMGLTGQVGGSIAQTLLREGKSVRGIVRDPARARHWEKAGVQLVVADSGDTSALREAFSGTDGVFVMLPPNFAPSPDFREARACARAITSAIRSALPLKVVALSSIGAQHDHGLGLITQLHIFESMLALMPLPTAVLRPAWFMENARWDLASAQNEGTLASYLHPLEKEFPMIAVADVGHGAAQLLCGKWSGHRVVEMEGPRRYSANDLAAALSLAFDSPVVATLAPRDHWESDFREQDQIDPSARVEMLDGFNSGWIEFGGVPAIHSKGRTELVTVIRHLVSGDS